MGNLKDRAIEFEDTGGFYFEDIDVKQFIKKLKEQIPLGRCWGHQINDWLDELSGFANE